MLFIIKNLTKGKLPRLPFVRMVAKVLGDEYEGSLIAVSSRRMRELNRTYRGKDKGTNVLSFLLGKNEGEIFLDIAKARSDAPLFDRSPSNFIGFLFIHSLFHLKGFDHSSTMEKQEKKIRAFFNI